MVMTGDSVLYIVYQNITGSVVWDWDAEEDIFYISWDLKAGYGQMHSLLSQGFYGDALRNYWPLIDANGELHVVWVTWSPYLGALCYTGKVLPVAAPVIISISPTFPANDTIWLHWRFVHGATAYHVYKAREPITSISGLVPLQPYRVLVMSE